MIPTGLKLHLTSLRNRFPAQLAEGDNIVGNVIIDPDVKVGANCKIGPNVSIGALCKIGDGVRLSNCVLLHRVEVRFHPSSSMCACFSAVRRPCRRLSVAFGVYLRPV